MLWRFVGRLKPGGGGPSETVVEPGVSGFIVDDVDAAVAAVRRIGEISRQGVRAAFETRFSSTAMARRYLSIYAQLRRSGAAPAGPDDIAAAISDLTHSSASEADLRRVRERLTKKGWPVEFPDPDAE